MHAVSFVGITLTSGRMWQVMRRFVITTMRDLGVGKRSLEENIQIEAQAVSTDIAKHAGKSYDIGPTMQIAVTNVICAIIFSER